MGEHDILLDMADLRGKRVADIGCGSGELVRFLRAHGAEPVGVECGEGQLAAARKADPEHLGAYLYGVGQDMPLADASMDMVTFCFSLHHVPVSQMDQALAQTFRVLVPGGEAFFMEPKAEGPSFDLDRLVDDETEVRAHAQAALGRAGTHGFEHVTTRDYETHYTYRGLDDYISMMVRIDPAREAIVARTRDRVEDAFNRGGVPVEGGRSFAQPNSIVVLRKPDERLRT